MASFRTYRTCGFTQFFSTFLAAHQSGYLPRRPPCCSGFRASRNQCAAGRRRWASSAAGSWLAAVPARTRPDRRREYRRYAARRISAFSSTTGPRPALIKMAEDFMRANCSAPNRWYVSSVSGRIRQTKSASSSSVLRSQ